MNVQLIQFANHLVKKSTLKGRLAIKINPSKLIPM